MLVLALLAATAVQQPATRVTPAVQATATVRIVSGARIKLGDPVPDETASGAHFRQAQFRDSDGQMRPARLVEFQ